jgi:D-3-phosphoglycerate dehydrogenase
MKPLLLLLLPFDEADRALLGQTFEVLYCPDPGTRPAQLAAHGAAVRLVLTNGTQGISEAELEQLPHVELVAALGAGYENIPLAVARRRGIVLVNGTGTNDGCVADHALALLLATVRDIPVLDQACRAGVWRDDLAMRPDVNGKRLGIVGLGTIGRQIAKRGLGFDMAIGYHNRTRRSDTPHAYFDSPAALAAWCDFLVIATPGGPATRHLIGTEVLQALGPTGYLVNIARGSVVDTAALAEALTAGRIAGAGLDVYESEPAPPTPLVGLSNVVLSPHVAGRSPEALHGSIKHFIDNATRHLADQPVLTPI